MAFRAGQKVICVDADDAPMLVLHATYTIKSITPATTCRWRGKVVDMAALYLYETEPEPRYDGFASMRFRPAVDRKFDISIFTKMLRPKSKVEV